MICTMSSDMLAFIGLQMELHSAALANQNRTDPIRILSSTVTPSSNAYQHPKLGRFPILKRLVNKLPLRLLLCSSQQDPGPARRRCLAPLPPRLLHDNITQHLLRLQPRKPPLDFPPQP